MTTPAEDEGFHLESPVDIGAARPTRDPTQQWRLESLLLCNWGGFGGVTPVDLHEDSTLLSGASGAGKSTILDGYTALLNPGRPFNVASNDLGEKRRGRNEGTRTTLTYVRGQYDRTERDRVLIPRVLRGDGQDTWSALAAVFVSSNGVRLTPVRLFFAPQEAAVPADMTAVYGLFDGRLERHHIESLEPLAQTSFRKDLTEKALPGLRIMTQTQYIQAVQSKLHIGATGEGVKALKLLHELQSGKPQPSVDALFKQMVLEQPVTFDEADAVVASFDKLDEGYRELCTKQAQLDVLAGIEYDQDAFVTAQEAIATIDTLRITDPDHSPFLLWAERRRFDLFEQEIELTLEEQQGETTQQADWEARADELSLRQNELEEQHRTNGGQALDDIKRRLETLEVRRRGVDGARASLARKTTVVAAHLPDTAGQFVALQQRGHASITAFPESLTHIRDRKAEINPEYFGLKNHTIPRLTEEQLHLKRHAGNISLDLHRERVRYAELAGVDPADLPFAGELIDMHPDHEPWRVAADAVLGGLARTILVDDRHVQAFRRAINGHRSGIRISNRGVPVNRPLAAAVEDLVLAGRVIVSDGPFSGWLRGHLNKNFDHACVETADELADDGIARVTRTGQTQRGQLGAHGGNITRNIGFSNEHRQAEVADELQAASDRVAVLERLLDDLENEEAQLRAEHTAWSEIASAVWSDLDLAEIAGEIATLEHARSAILNGSSVLAVLEVQIEQIKAQWKKANETAIRHKVAAEGHGERAEILGRDWDDLQRRLATLEADDSIRLDDTQCDDLDARLGLLDWDGTLDGFAHAQQMLQRELQYALDGAQKDLRAAGDRLVATFTRFQAEWHDPNRHTGLDSYEDYLAVLDDLRTHGLAGQRQKWSRSVIEYSGDRLSVLNNSYGRARDQINERLRPIRNILRHIPFGHGDRSLDIKVDHRNPESVRIFQARLRALAEGAFNPIIDDAAAEEKFEAIREVVDLIRDRSAERDGLLDVRRHLKVTAQVLDELEVPVSAYDYIADKSGGEMQMITAFICGAALRYQLGDESRDRPRFAPVVLDEAFIKADGRYTARAVDAWRNLGFQLVVAAPEDKFNALELAMGLTIGVVKDLDEHSYVVPAPRKRQSP